MVTMAHTSVPPWAVETLVDEIDHSGREFWIFAVGGGGDTASVVSGWRAALAELRPQAPCELVVVDDQQVAVGHLVAVTTTARIGARLMITGPAAACAAVRAQALRLGWTDQEIRVGSTSVADRTVSCMHCGAATMTQSEIEGVLACPGCDRNLLVYYHFSRRSGSFLGYMVDAEDGPAVETVR